MKRRARDGAAIAASLLVACAAVASCNFVVGVGDYSVGEADGTGGGPGDETSPEVDTGIDRGAGTDATTPPADARVGVGDARTTDASDGGPLRIDAGDGGPVRPGLDAGDAGTGVDGISPEAGADAGPVVCGKGIPTGAAFTSIVNACVLASGCAPFDFPIRLSDCITNDALHAVPGFSCLSSITSCTGVSNSQYSCEGDRYAASECATTFASSCVNNVAFDCSAAPGLPVQGVARNCNLTGGTCQVYTDSMGASRADCDVVPSCATTDGGSQCSGNTLYDCIPPSQRAITGIGFGFSCTGIDATCTTTPAGDTSCYYDGTATCSNPGAASCVGSTLQACTSLGQQFDYDCSKAGGTCAADTTGNVACVSPGCPMISTCTESCDGDHTLTVCVGGAPYTIDCLQYGANFTMCDSLSTFPRCIP